MKKEVKPPALKDKLLQRALHVTASTGHFSSVLNYTAHMSHLQNNIMLLNRLNNH